jgi:transposase
MEDQARGEQFCDMKKITTKAVFKPYDQQQAMLLPPSLDELIAPGHLVRVVNECIEQMDLSEVLNTYPGGGASAYHPKMLIKVLSYSYAQKIYSGRRIAKALQQDVTFMWMAGMQRPDFRTLNLFRSGALKQTMESVFTSMLLFLLEHGYVTMEEYFADGTDVRADANRHKAVWKKNSERFKQKAEEKIKELLREIDRLNEAEDKLYGDRDLEEFGGNGTLNEAHIRKQVSRLNKIIETTSGKQARKAKSISKQLQQQQQKLQRYRQQLNTAAERSGYSKTDPDATMMRTKTDELLPAYNVMLGTENQMIVNCSVHQNPNDGANFSNHLCQLKRFIGTLPQSITADCIFGTEENYHLLEQESIDNYLKFPAFHSEQTRLHQSNQFHKDNFHYEETTDSYRCAQGKRLHYHHTVLNKNRNGFLSESKVYESETCAGCPVAQHCKKGAGNRTLTVNERLEHYKQQARDNLGSEKGIRLRKKRGWDVESVIGDIKGNQNFRRFHLRGIKKVKAEMGLISLAHNLRKIHLQQLQKAA